MTQAKCWICGEPATTGEHMIKKSDLLAIFGKPKRGSPLYLHNASRSNQIIQGLNADALKLASRLCAPCNNARSQSYDRAWEMFSWFARNQLPPIRPGDYIRADRIFPLSSNLGMRHVQLFFVKLFGCLIEDNQIPIDLKPLANAFLDGNYHPDIFLRVGWVGRTLDEEQVGISGLADAKDDRTGKVIGAQWFYELDRFAVNIIYSPNHNLWDVTDNAWHPKFGTGRLLVHDFRKNLKVANKPVS